MKQKTLKPIFFVIFFIFFIYLLINNAQDKELLNEKNDVNTNSAENSIQISNFSHKNTISYTATNKEKQVHKKIAYITFDDGPNTYTPVILDILKKKNAKATFFMLEPNMKNNKEIVKRMIKEGHYPALHGVSHNKNILYLQDPMNVTYEMYKAHSTLKEITGVDSKLVRTPYGSKPYMTEHFRNGLVDYGFKMWDWSTDSLDWKYQNQPQIIFENVKKQVHKDKEVILFHDKEGTVKILEQTIDYLKSQGYELQPYNPKEHFVQNFWKDIRL